MRRFSIAVAGLACAIACATGREAASLYPFVFTPAERMGPDFSVRQHVEWKSAHRSGSFDAVLEKHGSTLTMVGLGPMGVRAFVVRQEGDRVAMDAPEGAEKPAFPPRRLAADIHRSLFKRLSVREGEAESEGDIDGERVHERWAAGSLVERTFARARGDRPFFRVRYGPGCSLERCTPDRLTLLASEYEIEITNEPFTFF